MCERNSTKSIKESLDSIAAQDFSHEQIKLVIVDDGSEDNTLLIVNDIVKSMDIKTIVLPTSWKGLGHARNTVIANSEGDYILWVDGDMILSRDFLRRLVEFAESNPENGIVKGKQMLLPGPNCLATVELLSRAAGRMVNYQSKRGQLKVIGTGGALYRIKAVNQAGSFDPNLRGYNEDWDFELRIRKAGWHLNTIDVYFRDYERYGLTWKSLWLRYRLRGYQTHYFVHKHPGLIKHYRMFPPAAALSGLIGAFAVFRLTQQKVVFLTPIQSTFKMVAWYVGFIASHFDSYAPRS